MRFLLASLLALGLVVGAAAVFLVATVPDAGDPVRFPLGAEHRALLGRVPASAEFLALIPSAATLQAKLLANPATRDAAREWLDRQPLPGRWLLGGADAVVWREGKETSFAIRFDRLRALIARVWTSVRPDERVRWEGSLLVIERLPSRGVPLGDDVLRLAANLPAADFFVVQRGDTRQYPPIGRPAVSSGSISAEQILLTSRAAAEDAVAATAIHPRLPDGAMLSVAFVEPPQVLGDLRRLLGTDVSSLVASGGSVTLYEVESGTLLPRPKGVIVMPGAVSAGADGLERMRRVVELVGELRERGPDLLVSFDGTSIDRYLADAGSPAAWPANRWAARIDPRQLAPVVERLGDSRGLRFVAPRLHRGARDLARWTRFLQQARRIEAAASVAGGTEEWRVRITSK